MRTKPTTGNRRSIRLGDFDYSAYGAYFVTICTYDRHTLLKAKRYRDIVDRSWMRLPTHFPLVELEEIAIMPDHVHFLVTVLLAVPALDEGASRRAPTLADIVRAFKGNAAREINQLRGTVGAPVWQRNYYERIVRNEVELERIREYIRNNPLMTHIHDEDDLSKAWGA